MTSHYHVLAGLHGYMPNYHERYQTRRMAELDMAEYKRELSEDLRLDSTEFEDKTTFVGSAKEGYIEVYNGSGIEYIEITVCAEKDCEEIED